MVDNGKIVFNVIKSMECLFLVPRVHFQPKTSGTDDGGYPVRQECTNFNGCICKKYQDRKTSRRFDLIEMFLFCSFTFWM